MEITNLFLSLVYIKLQGIDIHFAYMRIFRVLVTGGSQGASILSQVVPDGLAMLPVTFRRRLQVPAQTS